MSGGLAVIANLRKMMVYRAVRWRNRHDLAIPEEVHTKASSARTPNQTPRDNLTVYEVLDAMKAPDYVSGDGVDLEILELRRWTKCLRVTPRRGRRIRAPLNLGHDRTVTTNELCKKHVARHIGVCDRNSDNTLLRQLLAGEPRIALEEALSRMYRWIEEQVRAMRETQWSKVVASQ